MKTNYFLLLISLLILLGCKSPEKKAANINLSDATDSLQIFAEGSICTYLNERDMAISPDGTEFFYSILSYDNSVRVLMHCQFKSGQWSKPAPAEFAGEYFDLEPAFSPDGNRLFFVSNRPLNPKDSTSDHNIWYVSRTEQGWGDPQALSKVINTEAEEYYPSLAQNGNLYFTASYPDALGKEDIYVSRWEEGKYLQPEPLGPAVNSKSWEFNAYISPNEDLLIFTSFGRPDGFGGGDLYISTKDSNGDLKPARNMGILVNSEKLDFCPFIDWPRNTFYFTSNRTLQAKNKIVNLQELYDLATSPLNGMHNIYRLSLDKLKLN